MSSRYEVILIGAGFAGAATAYHLARAGVGPLLLLEREASFGEHASGQNAALFRQAVAQPSIAALIQETATALGREPSDWDHRGILQQTGSFLLGRRQRLEALAQGLAQRSVDSRCYPASDFPPSLPQNLKKILQATEYPWLLHTPSDGVVDVHALLSNYLQAASRQGLETRYSEEVLQISEQAHGWRIKTDDGEYHSPVVVNGAGAWAPLLVPQGQAPASIMRPFRRHLFISEESVSEAESWPFVWDLEEEYYFRPESGGLLMCPGDEEPHPPEVPCLDRRLEDLLWEKLDRCRSPLRELSIKSGWACLRTKRPDGCFQLGADSDWPGYFWAAALGGQGMSASYGVGKWVSRQIFDYLNEKQKTIKVSFS